MPPKTKARNLLVRYNLNGIELNEEGFQKLSAEIAMSPMGGNFPLPWGKERVQLYFGEVPLGDSLEPIVDPQRICPPIACPAGKSARKAPAPTTRSAPIPSSSI